MSDSPLFEQPYLQSGAANQEARVNDYINRSEALSQLVIQSLVVTDPSTLTPNNGQVWSVATSAVGVWAGEDGKLAVYYDGWIFVTPKLGWGAWLVTSGGRVDYTGSSWVAPNFLPRSVEVDSETGAYAIVAGDNGRFKRVDGAVTIPTGLGAGFQCSIFNPTGGALALTTTGLTVEGDSGTQLDAGGLLVIVRTGTDRFMFKGDIS